MGIGEKIAVAFFAAFLLLAVIRLFATPLRLAFKVLLNTAFGFAALFVLHLLSPLTGAVLGMNFLNAAVIGVLGLPGLILLILLQWIFV